MKTLLCGMGVFLLMFSGTSMAYCPMSLSAESMADCVVVESANEAQDDFRWDEVVADYEPGSVQDTTQERQPARMLALDNE